MKIRKQLLEDLLQACRNTFPNEFFALLGTKSDPETIEEFVVVPTVFGRRHSIVRADLVPFDKKIVGTIHSHPSKNNHPSSGDLDAFQDLGKIHLIAAIPFALKSTRAFNSDGKEIMLEAVE